MLNEAWSSARNGEQLTWMTRMLSPVSWASCSLMCRVGLGVAANAAFRVSSCLALMVVRGPRRFPPRFWSSFSLLTVSLSDRAAISVSFRTTSSCSWSWESGDKLGSLHAVTKHNKMNVRITGSKSKQVVNQILNAMTRVWFKGGWRWMNIWIFLNVSFNFEF